ncbi:MAG: twin-arginine translocation pathway signal [Bradyrhizobium sp.]|nr:twin-arginine translocation pathway signal [Bradyrhizobium sp.]
MVENASLVKARSRAAAAAGVLALALALSGCAEMSDSWTTAFVDPAKYELYDCKQLEPERKSLANREAELQGLMAKADTGVGGPVVSELAYRNDYIQVRGQARLLEEAWRKNKCHETPAPAAATPAPTPTPSPKVRAAPLSRAGSAVY